MGYNIIGPFAERCITFDGYVVPRLDGQVIDGVLHLCLDKRFALDVPQEHANQVIWAIANALAIGAGYSCFGENSERLNPFKTRLYGIDAAQAESGCENTTEEVQ